MPTYIDQLNRSVELDELPKKIISIVPSQTELLFDLGLNPEIIGITKFCTHPYDKVKRFTKIGGTKQLNVPLIKLLNPDLIIANKEENDQVQIEELMKLFPVWISDINNLPEAVKMVETVGEMVDKKKEALKISKDIIANFSHLVKPSRQLKVAYLIWRKPYMVAGSGTFIDSILKLCGYANVIEQTRYPELSSNAIIQANPDLIMLSSEPYPFGKKHIQEFKDMLPNAKVILVDGEMFSWYGSRMVLAPEYFNSIAIN